MNEGRIRKLVRELDQLVPRADASVRMTEGPEGVEVTATSGGALRLGVIFLRAALVEEWESNPELGELVDAEGIDATWIGRIEIVDELEPVEEPEPVRRSPRYGCLAAMLLGLAVFLVGVATVVGWLLSAVTG
ncbi:MAG TPA: hypothetical protein VF746_14480 [Longimicrobium sp.]|jgi:hypothetical protein